MAKPTTNAPLYCALLTLLTIVVASVSYITKNPLWIIVGLLPTVVYEAYRTKEGASTKSASILLLIILLIETVLIFFKVDFNLATFFGSETKYIAGYSLPLGDIKVVGPILTAILSLILFFRTYGIFTKWLSIVICIGSLTATWIIDPAFFQTILKIIADNLLNRINLY